MKRRFVTWAKRIGFGLLLFVVLLFGTAHFYIRYRIVDLPESSYEGTPSESNETVAAITDRLRVSVEKLAVGIGGRSIYNIEDLDKAKNWIADEFRKIELEPTVQKYQIEPERVIDAIRRRNNVLRKYGRTNFLPEYGDDQPTKEVANLWVEFKGHAFPDKILVVGAHYDTVSPDCPGADDNATGIAGLLEIARHLKKAPPKLTVFLVAFTCEEYPVGGINKMGSAVFAKFLIEQEKRRAVGMISLEMLGYYSDEPGSQKYPAPFSLYFPNTANFIGFVGDATSREFIRSVVGQFRQIPATIPSRGVAAPVWLAPDVLRSDHEPFIRNGIPGLMVTDTSNFRYGDHLHQATDTPDKLDFTRMAYVVDGLSRSIQNFED